MTITPELLLAISGIITGLLAFLSQRSAAKRQLEKDEKRDAINARKDEVQSLREEVDRLSKEVADLRVSVTREHRNRMILLDYISALRSLLIALGADVPPMPKLE